MAKVLVTESYLEDIGDAIRAKLETQDTYTPSEMAGAIEQISGGATLITKTITENGTYNATDDNADGYSQAIVNVPSSGLVPVPISPILNNPSFIGGDYRLSIGDMNYPNYRTIAIDLSLYQGFLIHIQNNGNRNRYGLYNANENLQSIVGFSASQSSNGSILFYADDYYKFGNWLIYDFTSAAENEPKVTGYNINI